MANPPNYLRLTPDTKNRPVSTPSRATLNIENVDAETDEVLHISPAIQAYMKIMEESIALQVEKQVQSALGELTKKHKEVEKRYLAMIKDLQNDLFAIMAQNEKYLETIQTLRAESAGHQG